MAEKFEDRNAKEEGKSSKLRVDEVGIRGM
jgi:hypothetical protein